LKAANTTAEIVESCQHTAGHFPCNSPAYHKLEVLTMPCYFYPTAVSRMACVGDDQTSSWLVSMTSQQQPAKNKPFSDATSSFNENFVKCRNAFSMMPLALAIPCAFDLCWMFGLNTNRFLAAINGLKSNDKDDDDDCIRKCQNMCKDKTDYHHEDLTEFVARVLRACLLKAAALEPVDEEGNPVPTLDHDNSNSREELMRVFKDLFFQEERESLPGWRQWEEETMAIKAIPKFRNEILLCAIETYNKTCRATLTYQMLEVIPKKRPEARDQTKASRKIFLSKKPPPNMFEGGAVHSALQGVCLKYLHHCFNLIITLEHLLQQRMPTAPQETPSSAASSSSSSAAGGVPGDVVKVVHVDFNRIFPSSHVLSFPYLSDQGLDERCDR